MDPREKLIISDGYNTSFNDSLYLINSVLLLMGFVSTNTLAVADKFREI